REEAGEQESGYISFSRLGSSLQRVIIDRELMSSLSSGRGGARGGRGGSSLSSDRIRGRGRGGVSSAGTGGSGGRERPSIVQAMRSANRGRGRRSSAFEVTTRDSAPASLQQLLKQARASGSLNLTSKGLGEVPGQVFNLLDGVDATGGEKFWEACELQRLDLSFNHITQLPLEVSNLSLLVSLKLRKNQLTAVPPEVFSLECLSLLDLTGNAIRELPEDELGSATALQSLLLSGNRLSRVPSSLGKLERLETLELSENTIRSLPESIGRLKRLATLTLSNNELTRLPESLGGLSSVKLLDVSRNAIEGFPDGLALLGALTSLDMRENKLTEVPPLPRSDRLAQVSLGFNLLTSLDGAALLSVSAGLTELHVQSNRIVHLPEEIGSLARLKTFDVSNNDLAELPAALGYLPELHRLVVDGNPLRTVRRSLLSGGASSLKKYLRTRGPCPPYPGLEMADEDGDAGEAGGAGGLSDDAVQATVRSALETGTLDLEGRSLTSLAPGLFQDARALSAVTRAKLSGNKLQTLPGEISRFESLTTIEANNNGLSSLPSELARMAIYRLSLRRNSLSSAAVVGEFLAPPSLASPGSLPLSISIRELDLSSNGLGEMPPSIFACRGLQTLILGFNALTDVSGLPWASLATLETLDLSSNRLRILGDVVLMTWLRHLNLENNEISPVPLELGLCTGLESLVLAGNPQRQVSASLLQRGTAATLSYLSTRLPPGHRPRAPQTPPPIPAPFVENAKSTGGPAGAMSDGGSDGGGGSSAIGGNHRETEKKIAALKAEVTALSEEVGAPGMSQAKAYAVKKKLQMKRAAVIREERALKQAQQGGGGR
ncbi:unnamed protein product, partial [Pylaiella littoralis]